jgi:hypothetical protein
MGFGLHTWTPRKQLMVYKANVVPKMAVAKTIADKRFLQLQGDVENEGFGRKMEYQLLFSPCMSGHSRV